MLRVASRVSDDEKDADNDAMEVSSSGGDEEGVLCHYSTRHQRAN